MAIRQIVTKGDEILGKRSKEVKEINIKIKVLVEDMIDTMNKNEGVGLAAVQVGVLKRIFVARPYLDKQDEIFVMINPQILELKGEQDSKEGCLSVPGFMGCVKRPKHVKVLATDLDGNEKTYQFSDFEATVICHEYDHLEGVLYTDKANEIYSEAELQNLS